MEPPQESPDKILGDKMAGADQVVLDDLVPVAAARESDVTWWTLRTKTWMRTTHTSDENLTLADEEPEIVAHFGPAAAAAENSW